jgi:hypothetical protein
MDLKNSFFSTENETLLLRIEVLQNQMKMTWVAGHTFNLWTINQNFIPNQGGQIGRIFAFWAIVYFWSVFSENDRGSPNVCGIFFHNKSYV